MSTKKKVLIILLSVIALIFIVGYFSGAIYYKDKFLSNVHVNKVDVGSMNLTQANEELAKTDKWDKIVIKSDTEDFLEIKVSEIDYKYVDSPDLPEILDEQNNWKWFLALFKDSTYTTVMNADYNKDKINEWIDGMKNLDTEPLNAHVGYSESAKAFVVKPHVNAINLTREQMMDLLAEAIAKRNSEINVEANIERPTVFADDESLERAKDEANEYLALQLKYDFGDRRETIDGSLIKNWITINEGKVDIDPEKVKEYVVEIARKYDTYGRSRNFVTHTGRAITISGGTYGWVMHRGKSVDELVAQIKAKENKTLEPVYSYKALIRNADDIGNSYVEIDLAQQMVLVFINGEQRVKTPTVTGNVSKGYHTPTGIYPLNYKERNAVLRGENYASPVKYWMPFNGNIGLHDADWRDTFGGNIYQNNGSHGCINLPPENAKTMFDLVYPGMPVIVH